MRARTAISLLGAAAVVLAGMAVPASASQPRAKAASQNYCEDWEVDELPPDYCKITPAEAHVYVEMKNNTGREVRAYFHGGLNTRHVREWTSAPGKTIYVWGFASIGTDIWGWVSWCPTVKYSDNCAGKLTADLSWKNPTIGWPWMEVHADKHGFRSMEKYTFEEAYGPAGTRGVAKFKAQRLTDKASGTKRYIVDFTFAAPVTRPRR